MARKEIIDQAQTYAKTATTYGRQVGSTTLSKLSEVFASASDTSSEYAKDMDPESKKGKAAKVATALLGGAAIAAAAGGSWLLRNNQIKNKAREAIDPYRTPETGEPTDTQEPIGTTTSAIPTAGSIEIAPDMYADTNV